MKLSIVMTYHERLFQLENTLASIKYWAPDDFELIIVDDASKFAPLDETFRAKFIELPIRLVRIEKKTA
jgi:hypothetical protein